MNKDKRNNIQLLGTLNNADESGIIANANQVYDANEDKSTQDVSKEHKERIETLETKESSMQTTLENITKTGEASAASNVTYNHSDSKLDATNVQQAVDKVKALLDTKANKVDVVFDISAYHATGGTLATYDNLEDALGTNGKNIPQSLKKGGMSVKFVQTSDNKYVQWRLMATDWSTNVANWQGVDDEPTAGSDNLSKSKSVWKIANRSLEFVKDLCEEIQNIGQKGLIRINGNISSNDDYYVTDYIDCKGFSIVKYSTFKYTSNTWFCSVVFYNEDKIPLNCGVNIEVSDAAQQSVMIAAVPSGAAYFRISQKMTFLKNSFCYAYIGENDTLLMDLKNYGNGYYDGNGYHTASVYNFRVSPVIHLNKGDVLFIKVNKERSSANFSVLSSIDIETVTTTPIINAISGINSYEYVAENSIDVVLSIYLDENCYLYIDRNRNAATEIGNSAKFVPANIIKGSLDVLTNTSIKLNNKLNDKINNSQGLQDCTSLIKSNLTNGLIKTDGSIDGGTVEYKISDYIYCKGKSLIRYSTYSYSSPKVYCSIVFFDEDKNALRCGKKLVAAESISQIEQIVSVPESASYFRVSQKADFIDTSYCFVYINSSIDTTLDYRSYAKGVYDGTQYRNTDNDYVVSPIIHLNKGDVVFVTTTSPINDAYNVISLVDLQTLNISSLVSAKQGTNDYEYEATSNIDIAINVFLDANTSISINRDRNAATEIDDSNKFTPAKVVKEKTDELSRAISEISVNGASYYDMYLNGGINTFDLENVATYIGWVDNPSGKWNPRDTFSHSRFRVSPCSTVTITAKSDKPAYYALLKSYPKTNNVEGEVDYAYSQSEYSVVNAGQTAEINIPFNCYCIVLCVKTPDYVDMLPDTFIINNYGINNLPSNSFISSLEADVLQLMAHKNTPIYYKGVLYDIFMQDDTQTVEMASGVNTITIRLTERTANDIKNYVAKTVFQASTKYQGFQTTGRVSPRHPNLVLDSVNDILYCFASIVASGGLSYVPISETMAFRKYHIKENKFDYDVTVCKIGGEDFNISNLINAYSQVVGTQVAISGTDLNGSGKIIKASNGYYYWGIGCGTKDYGGLILKSNDLINWSVETYYPVTLPQVNRNWTWEISLEEISEGVLIAAARTENIGVTIAKYTLSSGTWGSIVSTPLMATRPFIFKDSNKFYLIGNISGSVTTPDYGTVGRATTGIYKINSDLSLTQLGTVVVAEGCHYAEVARVIDKIYLLYTTDSKRLDSTYVETNIGIKDITDIFE